RELRRSRIGVGACGGCFFPLLTGGLGGGGSFSGTELGPAFACGLGNAFAALGAHHPRLLRDGGAFRDGPTLALGEGDPLSGGDTHYPLLGVVRTCWSGAPKLVL